MVHRAYFFFTSYYLESQQWWPRTACHELEKTSLLVLGHPAHDLPEHDDCGMLRGVAIPVPGVQHQILHVNLVLGA